MASLWEYNTGTADVQIAHSLHKNDDAEEKVYIFARENSATGEAADRSHAEKMTMDQKDQYIMLSSLF